jgi:predicted amidohydrolase
MDRAVVVAAVQLSSQGEVAENLAKVDARVAEAAERGAELVVLPENFAYFGDEAGKRAVAEDLSSADGPIATRLAELARRHGVHLVAGGVPERAVDDARPYNACVAFTPDGAIAAVYRKLHLFDVELGEGNTYRESASTTAGADPVVVELAGAKVGLSVCAQGAEILVVPAAFTLTTGKDHWHVLLRARAIEAQAYVIAAAQWGKHPRGRATFGKSCVVDPWGEIVAQASEGEGVVIARLDPAYLAHVRAILPALAHRRL